MDHSNPNYTRMPVSPKALVVWFFVVLVLYLAVFYGFEHFNHRQGPWQVQFLTDTAGTPRIIVSQPALRVADVTFLFPGETTAATNLPGKVAFDEPRRSVPFGQVLYEDLRTLPGVVTLELFGHEIELLPRVLIVNKRQIPWQSGAVIHLSATNRPAFPPKPPKSRDR